LTVNVCAPMVIVPARVVPLGFAAALKLTVPVPLPVAPAVTVNQLVLLLTAVQEHPLGDVTVVDPVPPPARTDCDAGERLTVHGAAAWFTVNVCPPIVSVPARVVPLGFAAALKLTAPLPLPEAPAVMVSQLWLLLTAVHEHPVGDVTVVDPVPPAAMTDCDAGVRPTVHGAAAWFTVNVWPAMVSVPARVVPLGLAAALKLTVPLPLPVAPAVTLNQLVLLLTAVHVQPVGAVTFVAPVPPLAMTDCDVGATENVHGAAAWFTVKVCPAIMSVPLRGDPFELAATL
jgi:hypothetical protein